MERTMRRVMASVGCVLLMWLLPGCTVGSGDVVTETRSVEGFDEIELRGVGEVVISVDGTETLSIEAEDNIIDGLITDVRDGRLILGTDRPIRPTEDIIFTVTMQALEAIEISGSGAVTVGEFSTSDFDIDVSGSGAAGVSDIVSDSISARISGSGAISISGDTDDLTLSISGSGAFDGEGLEADTGDVNISGSGSATVNVSEDLDANISGSGSVEYLGNPNVSVDTSGSGNVSRR
jgi:hypothetical protein